MQYFYSYTHFFSAVIFLNLFILILVRDYKSHLNQMCSCVFLCFFIWSFSFTWIHHPPTTAAEVRFYEKLGSIGWICFAYFNFLFVWLYTKQRATMCSRIGFVFLTIVPMILVYQQWANEALVDRHLARHFGWLSQWNLSVWSFIYFAYCATTVVVALSLIIRYGKKSDNPFIRYQSVVMLVTGAVAFVLGFMVNIILPIVLPGIIMPVGDVTALVWASGMAYVAIKYNMLNITPFVAANRIISTMKDLLFLLDTHGYIISVNKAATQTLACKNHLLTGRQFGDLIHDDNSGRVATIEKMKNTNSYTGETSLSLSPGPVIPVALSTSLIPGTGIVCVAHDISLQKQRTESLREAKRLLESRVSKATEELQKANERLKQEVKEKMMAAIALKESEERFRIIFEFAPDGIYLIDSQGNLIDGNNEALLITGYEKGELSGKNVFEVGLIPIEDSDESAESMFKRIGGIGANYKEITIRRKDGTFLQAEISSHPITIGGKKLGIGIVRDLSQRKKAEAEAEELKLQLHQAQKMEAIGRLAGGIAHDFNNLLGGIIGYAGLVRKRLLDKQPAESSIMQRIIDVAKQASDRTAQLLAFARKGKYQAEPVNMHVLIEEVIGLMEHTIDPRITLVKKCDAVLPVVTGDRSQLHSALLNLGVNARDALPQGGTIIFSTQNVEIAQGQTALRPDRMIYGTYLQLVVADNGIGMDDVTRSRVFEPFFSTKEPGKGTGLGLASVYGTIKHHNGLIDLETMPGKGTKFIISMPVSDAAPVTEKIHPEVFMKQDCKGNILVVDDTPLIRDMMADTLSDLGYTVHACDDGNKAIAWFRENYSACNLVILDFTMPDINGKECFCAMKEINPLTKAIITSGHAVDGEIGITLDSGVKAFLQKPFEVETLSEMVQTVLAGNN